jgi:SMC interacting uncharacterized protein involved in chromosome segregation
MQKSSDDINKNLQKLKSDIDRDIHLKVTDLSSEKDNVCAEINKIYHILSGLTDCITESNEQLSIALNRVLSELVFRGIEIDCAFRQGSFRIAILGESRSGCVPSPI